MAIRSVFQGGSVKRSSDIAAFEQRLGYEFRNLEILLESLTHPSIASQTRSDNQRLEFLGDRVLGLVMAEALVELDTTAAEGTLAPRFNALVRKETCADVARAIDLGAVLKLGRSEMKSGGRRKDTLLGDAMEAVIAAIYIDAGFGVAKKNRSCVMGGSGSPCKIRCPRCKNTLTRMGAGTITAATPIPRGVAQRARSCPCF